MTLHGIIMASIAVHLCLVLPGIALVKGCLLVIDHHTRNNP